MAVDKLVDSTVLDGYFEDIADAIRGKNGSSDTYTPSEMPAAITAIPSGGGDTLYDALYGTDFIYENEDITETKQYMFYQGTLKGISLPNCTTVANSSFYQCRSLTSIDLPNVTTFTGGNTFYGCTAITEINLPKLTTTGYNTFSSCTQLREANLPSLTKLGSSDFMVCTRLQKVILGPVTSIGTQAFRNCSACLEYDFTSCTVVPTITNVNVFTGINSNAQIKVPAALEADWKAAKYWSTYADHIVGV